MRRETLDMGCPMCLGDRPTDRGAACRFCGYKPPAEDGGRFADGRDPVENLQRSRGQLRT